MDTVISPEMTAALGSQLSRNVSYPVSASDIRRWVLATYWPEQPPERYLSVDEASVVAPEEFNPFAWRPAESEAAPLASSVKGHDPDRTEKQLGIDGPGLKFQLNGGSDIVYDTTMQVGDVITSVVRLSGYTEREGKLGHMLFTTTEDTWTNQRGEVIKRLVKTLIRYGKKDAAS